MLEVGRYVKIALKLNRRAEGLLWLIDELEVFYG